VIAIVGISGVGKDGLVVNGQCTGSTTPGQKKVHERP
jgi:hypothetical protein